MKKISFLLLIAIVLFSSCNEKKNVTDARDYEAFLHTDDQIAKKISACKEEIDFWTQRLQKDTGSYGNMMEVAHNILYRFKLKGDASDLKIADSLFKRSSEKLNATEPNIFYALSQNAITQHRFNDAMRYVNEATDKGGPAFTNTILRYDADMELGNYTESINRLEGIKDKNSFDYLIRKAKWEDHSGNLGGAVKLMEKAFDKVKSPSSYRWLLSNLGDMYGHAGRIQEAYDAYLNVLKKDSTNLYCLKGIAWIVYSADHNTSEAKRIIHYILSHTGMPDLYLMLEEIEAFEKNEEMKQEYLNKFIHTVADPKYGAMYNKYLITIYTEQLNDPDKALKIANEELDHRPTPEVFSWLAWAWYKKGDAWKAAGIMKTYVEGKDFEPLALMRMATIYAAQHQTKKAKQLFKECLNSSFELGPVYTASIKEELKKLSTF